MLLRRLTVTLLPALLLSALPVSAHAAVDVAGPATPASLVREWKASQVEMAQALADQAQLTAAPAPAAGDLLATARRDLALENATYRYRAAARKQQVVVYAMAVDPAMQSAVQRFMSSSDVAPVLATIAALRSLWRLAEIDDLSQIRIRYNRRLEDAAPVDALMGYYRTSGGRWSIEWTFLASINFVESDFGRVNGPSSAGALGPMQFMPSTWAQYGTGDVMNPKDAIEAAARYLRAMGGPGNMDRAIYRYNNDTDYVAAIDGFAAAYRSDPSWAARMYYWSTSG
ncbi:MAG TPA: transglycosylase SLT domain-containing protein [Candidatus Dormibacteraeota bacterium]